jgi:uncharacterized paraquat-inducible protein A
MAGKKCGCARCRYFFRVPYLPELSAKKPRCPRCGSYAVEQSRGEGPGVKKPCDTGVFLP